MAAVGVMSVYTMTVHGVSSWVWHWRTTGKELAVAWVFRFMIPFHIAQHGQASIAVRSTYAKQTETWSDLVHAIRCNDRVVNF